MTKKYEKAFKIRTIRLIQEEGKPVLQYPGKWDCRGQLKPEDQALRDVHKRIGDLEEANLMIGGF
ncbi:hypothetical protein P9314_03710 [Paenibacillus validus]|uniref:hypothetical protein n=1 Tax=Paenibacillus validus TaxID=44253 RepID=UPI000FD9A623|nr:hypothetical protein [Paenibacillus validus]MED4599813.1 hypothetical protein [Paenibacillus validus]MED4604657.1 hypothetical protein [Paenibacillus validus]